MPKAHRAWDLTALTQPQRDVLVPAFDACTFPFGRITKRTGKRVPVSVSDLSRHARALDAHGHGHVHQGEEHAHLLGEPERARKAPLGLYWLPSDAHPAGRIEIGESALNDPDLAREVLLAEAAHAVDYGALTETQRSLLSERFDWKGEGEAPVGWFEELGEPDYWDWRGERWMGLFMATYAPELPRPLEQRQPWTWSYDAADVRAVRRLLRRP